jgi:hypothetical protein
MSNWWSWVVLFGQEHCTVIEKVGIRVISVDKENFGNVPPSRAALDMDYDVERICDVRLDRSVRQLHAALQYTAREAREALLRGTGMNGRQRARMSRV